MLKIIIHNSQKQQQSTYSLDIFPYTANIDGIGEVQIEFWDTAGQDIFDKVVCIILLK